ncbi:calcium-binding protein [Streptomyces sp. SAS_270]|uniref:calcium-binding protein n=1 Tax=Streptomyces sp. SAS_270 TaxID=3412748 RepID=UPI00403D024B
MTSSPPDPPWRIPATPPERRGRLLTLLALAGALIAVLAVTLGQCRSEDAAAPVKPWADGSTHGRWFSVFNGHGTNRGDDDSLTLSPMVAEDPGTTHAGLVVSTASYGDLRYEARMRTIRQLREGAPNPWEVPWLVWAYTDPEHFYYITLKPNGWELGKRDPDYPGGQRFLATGKERFPVGKDHKVVVEQHGPALEVTLAARPDRPLVTFTDTERPYLHGRVGAYTEDATVKFQDLKVS